MSKEYTRGVNFERQLVEKFSENGFISMRLAGSGRYSKLLPDIIVIKKGVVAAIQCKKSKNNKIYISKGVENFRKFKEIANIKCFFAVKFIRKDVRFYDLEKINGNIGMDEAHINYDEFIANFCKIDV